jgi:hypothetical protein
MFSLSDLLTSHEVLVQQEAQDRAKIVALGSITVESPEFTTIKSALVQWASRGCPDAFPMYTINIFPPTVCTDGVSRMFLEYVQYLLPEPLVNYISTLNALLPGMKLTYSFTDTMLRIDVSTA